MCGIVGFVGSEGAKEKIIDGLKKSTGKEDEIARYEHLLEIING